MVETLLSFSFLNPVQEEIKTISAHFFRVITFPANQGVLQPPEYWTQTHRAQFPGNLLAQLWHNKQISLFSGSEKHGSSSLSTGSKRWTFIPLNAQKKQKTIGMDDERIFSQVLRSSKRLSVFLDKDPASFPSSERGEGGGESLPSVNVPTSLRLLCFVPTCAFQLSALAAVSGSLFSKLCSHKCSVPCCQHKESTATKYRHQFLDLLGRKCRKILSVIN